jgi:Protein of unknown function (DUF2914)/Tetratricopeptide repeat
MPEARDTQSVLAAAEQAAAAGDHVSAEQLLREVAILQEASLGPLHPDLANTLNNLGIVSEIIGKPDEAERFFRRAFAIATAVLEPDHPFVATSRKNLEDFCEARGVPLEPPAPPAAVAVERDEQPARFADLRQELPPDDEAPPLPSRDWSRPVLTALVIAAALFVTFLLARPWFRASEGVGPSAGRSTPTPASRSAPTSAPTSASPAAAPAPTDVPGETAASTSAPVGAVAKSDDTSSTARPGRESRVPAAAPPLVVEAHLCKGLSTGGPGGSSGDWQCDPPSPPLAPGLLFFYTRLKSPGDTTIQHRWYRGDRLRQAVELPIRANTTSGYRTYSRQTVDGAGSGDWRVELRTRDGALLHEERFVVR